MTVLAVVLPAVCSIAALRALLTVVTVNGGSMEPAYREGEHLLMLRKPLARARTGSVVVFRLPQSMRRSGPGRNPLLIKRLAAVGGQPIPASVLEAVGAREGDVVPDGKVILLADAAGISGDSRSWGYLPAGAISGVIIGRLSRATPESPTRQADSPELRTDHAPRT